LLKSIASCCDTAKPVHRVCPIGAAAPGISHSQLGLNLLELMMAIAILGIVLAIGIPSYSHMTISNGLTTDTNDLVATMQFARSEAITRGENVTVCAANGDLDACSGGGDWTTGWVILDAGGNPIRVHPPLSENTAAEVNIQNGVGAVVFNRNGFSTNARTIRMCGPKGDARRIRGVVISPDGRIRLAADVDGDNVVEDQDGNNLGC
jgi:prepilin-type N-terminal cleavage/methylation domain-containing protein